MATILQDICGNARTFQSYPVVDCSNMRKGQVTMPIPHRDPV